MQLVAVGKPFDGPDALALRLDGEHQARTHGFIVEDHGAGPTDAVLAADMGPGLPAVVADDVGERLPRLDLGGVVTPVDRESDLDSPGHGSPFRSVKLGLL